MEKNGRERGNNSLLTLGGVDALVVGKLQYNISRGK